MKKLTLALAVIAMAVLVVGQKPKVAAGPHTQRPQPPCQPCVAVRGEPIPVSRTN
jgi:hypothetical protein